MGPDVNKFTYRITWSEEDQEFVGLCIEDMVVAGEDIPVPISTRQYSGKFIVRVPPEVHRNLVLEAAEAGVSLNRIISARLANQRG